MRFGLNSAGYQPHEIIPLAVACEEAGLDHFSFNDAPFFPETTVSRYPYSGDGERDWPLTHPVIDPWVGMAIVTGKTKRITLMTAVLRMPIRKPLLEAKMASSVAALGGTRIALGVGLAWMEEEFWYTNEEMKTRGARVDEAIEILRLCFTGEFVEYHGKHYDFGRLIMEPHPDGKVPIYVGGLSEPALRRAARLGDGWMGMAHDRDDCARIVERLTELRREYGRECEPFDVIVTPTDATSIDDYRRLEDVGVTDCWVVPWAALGGQTQVQSKVDAVMRFGEEVASRC
jgi:probable F420-dependent oxidoreductase